MSSPKNDEIDQHKSNGRQRLLGIRSRIDELLHTSDSSFEDPDTISQIRDLEVEFRSIRQSQEEFEKSDLKSALYNIASNLPKGTLCVLDSNLIVEHIQGKGLEMLNHDPKSLVGADFPNLNPSESDRKKLRDALQRTLEGEPQEFKMNYNNHYFQFNTTRFIKENDNPKVICLIQDITNQKVGDIKLQTALDASGIIVGEYDFRQENFRPNKALYELIGWPAGKPLTLDKFIEFYHEDDRQKRREQIARGGQVGAMDYDARIRTPSGMKWIRVVGNTIPDTEGAPRTGIAAILDITKDKELIEKARLSEERFKLIADSAPVMIWMGNAAKDSIYLNPKWLEFTGRTLEEELGNGWLDHLHPDKREEFLYYRDKAFEEQKSFQAELQFRRKDGEYRWLLNSGAPIFDEKGVFRGFIGSCIDITEQKHMTQTLEKLVAQRTDELARSNKELTDLNIHLEEYAHAASHDLQEPLRKIEMFLSIIKENLSSPEKCEAYIAKVEDAAHRMRALVQDILNFSTLGNTRPDFEQVDLDQVFSNLLEDFELLIEESGTQVKKDKLGTIQGDRAKLHQVFSNLIKNAITYNEGSPEIVIRSSSCKIGDKAHSNIPLKDGITYKCIEVQDNGIGFKQDKVEQILKPFQRLHSRKHYPGTGLGLSIVNRIVDIHNGFLDVESEQGKGANFKIYLPETHHE